MCSGCTWDVLTSYHYFIHHIRALGNISNAHSATYVPMCCSTEICMGTFQVFFRILQCSQGAHGLQQLISHFLTPETGEQQ